MSETGVVDIRGREYQTVALRLHKFRTDLPGYSIQTKCESAADIIRFKTTIRNEEGRVLATGHAEEVRDSTQINRVSALECCETSSCGRALALMGYLGTEIATDEDIERAKAQQADLAIVDRLREHNAAVRDHIESITAIKAYLLNDEYSAAYEAYSEIPDEDKKRLTLAPTKGGIWTTEEIKKLRSNEWTAARREFHGLEEE